MPPKKKVAGLIKLQIQAGAATPAPPVGPALGQHGVNIMEFVKAYNAATESQRGNVIPVEITVYEDRSFTFVTKTPPAAELIKKAAGVAKGSGEPHKTKVAQADRRPGPRDRPDQDGGPQRQRRRAGRREDHRRHRPLDGHHRRTDHRVRRTRSLRAAPQAPARGRASAGPSDHTSARSKHTHRSRHEAQQGIPRSRREDRRDRLYAPLEAVRLAKETTHHQVRRDRRGRHAPRRRPPQGRPDGPRHRQPAARHRQDRPGPGLRHR